MIRNGLYLAETRFLDGVEAYNRHIMVLRDGTMRGGGGFYYTVGRYTCAGGKWKGEMTSQEHSPIAGTYPWARKVMSIGFTGTYSDGAAEFEATALAGKQSFRFGCCTRIEVRGTEDGLSPLRNPSPFRTAVDGYRFRLPPSLSELRRTRSLFEASADAVAL